MRLCLLILIGLLNLNILLSQQDLQISQYMYSHLLTNPGSAGSNDMICVNSIVRQQWLNFPGAPQNLIFNFDLPFKLLGANHGAGVSMVQDKFGNYTDIDLKLSYAYRANVSDGKLGIGIYGGFINRKLEAKWQVPAGENINTDPQIPQENQNEMTFDLGLGLFYRTEDLYMGVSATHLILPSFDYQSSTGFSSKDELNIHYYLTAGYNLQMANPSYELKPSVFIKTDTKITSYDFNVLLAYNKKIWGGVSYRLLSSIIGMIGIDVFNGLKIGYAYDFATNSINKYSAGTHEFTVNYCFKIGVEKGVQKYKSIRFL